MTLDTFVSKLDKIDGNIYAIEEVITMPASGVYEAYLEHDNIDEDTLQVYTGASLTGSQIMDYSISIPSNAPWKRQIHIETNAQQIYISYQTSGDQVECEDINQVHAAIRRTQNYLNEIADDVRGSTSAYTWNKLMGIVSTSTITISTQPTSVTVNAGQTAEFTIEATGDTITYKWQYRQSGASSWSNFTDGSQPILDIANTSTSWDGANIRCVITDGSGNVEYSNTVTLTVLTA